MPSSKHTHPDTGKSISRPVYEAIMAERARLKALLDAQTKLHEQRPDAPEDSVEVDPNSNGTDPPAVPQPAGGCMVPILITVVIAMASFMVWDRFGGKDTLPQPSPITPNVIPATQLSHLVQPIAKKLAGQSAKADAVHKAYSGFAAAIEGPSGQRITDTRKFAAAHAALLTDVEAGGGTPIGTEIDAAIGSHLGINKGRDKASDPLGWEFKQLGAPERQRLVEVLRAISQAGRDAG